MTHTILFQKFRRTLHKAYGQDLDSMGVAESQASKTAKYKRRKFLKMGTLAGGAAIATTAIPFAKAAQSRSTTPKIAIVGGGIAGLNAAYQLKKAGLEATVYEARSRVGGRIHSVTGVAGEELVTDLGGAFINTNHEDMLALVKEFNLSLFNRVATAEKLPFPTEGYFFNGRLYPEAEVAEKLRPIARQIVADATLLEQDSEQYAPIFDRLSVAQYLEQHADQITEPFIKVLLENTIRTEYGVEPESSSTLHLLYNLTTVENNKVTVLGGSDETYVVQGGIGKITESLAAALPQQIQTRKRLQAIRSDGDGYRLTFSDRSTVNADYVIIAIPLAVLRNLDLQVKLKPKFRKFIREVNLGQNEKVFAGFKERVWLQKQGFSGSIWTDLGFSTIYDETQRQPDAATSALTFFLGSKEVTAISSESLSSVQQSFLERFEQIIPQAKSAATGKFFRTNWCQDPLTTGGYTNFEPGQYTEFSEFLYVESEVPEERQNVVFGNLIFAGEHFSDEFYGYMNGGAQTGRLAAAAITTKVGVVKT
ncbi:MAG TPA: NAD(P)/FAD-dependent oxidoreductase [Coleofasciculaceae cyanobacterium]|jgi:monoamine oxidase